MANTKNNALTELAERLKWLWGEVYCIIGHDEADDISKAQRIVSELAKVKVEAIKENPFMVGGTFINLMAECRAIAEEG